ncbi:MAG: HAMP domain-containing sensor histidine kinase [Verrucomicrobiales bacterium]
MRLPDFILAQIEPILEEWESFARSIWPGPMASRVVLRDHGADMLRAVALEMKSHQTASQQSDKSKGRADDGSSQKGKSSDKVDAASNQHALSRLASGFELRELVAEYRALRSSVLKLWTQSMSEPNARDIEDIIRFNEGIDQLLTESIASFARSVDGSRDCFLGILGHDLRSPLTSATLFAHMLEESKTLDPKSLQMATTLCHSLDAMNLLVRDLLDFTGNRLGAKMEVSPQQMDLRPLCEEVLNEIRAIHPKRTLVFNAEGDGDLAGEWDGRRLRQLISNLLGNAVQHGCADSPITLTATPKAAEVQLTVHNRGATIPEDILGAVFDPMRSRQTGEHSVPAGSVGLGLYIAREVANAHGGSIAVASADEETVFTVQLPRATPTGD